MYINNDTEYDFISLHDCLAEEIRFENGVLSFVFPNGYWVTPNHPKNTSQNTVHTDSAQVDFLLMYEDIYDVTFSVYRTKRTGKIEGRVFWKPEEFIELVNDGKIKIEFINKFCDYKTILYKCWIYFDSKPYHCECEIILNVENVVCRWNSLNYDRIL